MEETVRLYQDDSYLKSCMARVVSCVPAPQGEGFLVQLDQTVFFPEGGGQPSDRGTIGGVAVTHVREQGEQVLHLCASALAPGKRVEAVIDFDRRLEMMQQHSGEHVLACAGYRLFGVNNVGFHLGEDSLAVDFDRFLEPEELEQMEEEANRILWANVPIVVSYLTPKEYEAIPMRKKAEHITGRIRMVSVQGLDNATCCGTHVSSTAQIGMIKILSAQRYKGGQRVEFLCGMRALWDYRQKNQTVNTLSAAFSVKPEGVLAACQKQGEELLALSRELKGKTAKLLTHQAAALLAESEKLGENLLINHRCDQLSPEEAKELLTLLLKAPQVAAMIWVVKGERLLYFFGRGASCPVNMKLLCARAGELLEGRGGGSPALSQGSAPLPPCFEEISGQLFQELRRQLEGQTGK